MYHSPMLPQYRKVLGWRKFLLRKIDVVAEELREQSPAKKLGVLSIIHEQVEAPAESDLGDDGLQSKTCESHDNSCTSRSANIPYMVAADELFYFQNRFLSSNSSEPTTGVSTNPSFDGNTNQSAPTSKVGRLSRSLLYRVS